MFNFYFINKEFYYIIHYKAIKKKSNIIYLLKQVNSICRTINNLFQPLLN